MAAEGKRRNLGRGLSALLGGGAEDYAALEKPQTMRTVPIDLVRPGRIQPRRRMDMGPIRQLAHSIAEKGILQPLLVRRHAEEAGAFEIVAGERRWRAAQMARLHEIPVVVKELSDSEALEIALVENLQREDLSPLEEAEAYKRLMEEFSHTQEALSKAMGKSRSHVANMLRLLGLPGPVKEMLDRGELTAGHARALLRADDPLALARKVVGRGLNVRQAEKLARGAKPRRPAAKDADTAAIERDLTSLLGLKVEIRHRGEGGTLKLHYTSLEQLDDVLHRLSHGNR
ncbi:MAG: ParB/RepB/Spo0J family partition protein [Proteobacteria bacterium]|nr:ParB/RepB/Spo0J family partition protein [Pseudomonadota bacterium]